MTLLRTAATDASDARALATASAEQSELVRAQWTAAAQRTKGLERLRERHMEALQHAEDAAEERAVDDLVTGRAGRVWPGAAPTPRRSRGRSDRGPDPDQRDPVPLPRTGRQSTSGDWASAAAAAGLDGTSATSAYSSSGATATESAVVAEAQKYLGVPYLWGGTDPAKGLDCSGFTQLVFGNLGIDLPRTSSQQATAGRPVASLADARPGDLVFFDHSSSRAGIDHVGIYIGNGQDGRRPAAGRGGQGPGRRQPDRHPPGAPGADGRRLTAAAGSALAGVPYANLFTQAASRYGVDASLLAAVASQESSFNSQAVSPAGAQGLMQFMPATAKGLGVNALDPTSAINGAAKYLSSLTEQFGSTELALAAYNAGPGTVSRYGGIPPYSETQNYVRAVMTKAEAYR